MQPVPLTPLGVGEILSHAFDIYRDRFGDLARAVVVALLPLTAIRLLLDLVLLGIDDDQDAMTLLLVLVGGLLTLVAGQIATAAAFQIAGGAYVGLRPTWEESLSFGYARVRSVILLELLLAFFVLLGLLALIVPGIYLAVAWQLAVPVLLFEGLGGSAALRRSRELLSGRWWPAFGLVLLLGLLSTIVSALVGTLVSGLTTDSNDVFDLLVFSLGNLASSVVTLPLMAAATTVLYVQALARRGEADLSELADRLSR
ncbi:MAG: hypothetical protein AB7H43_04990 [Acidimicrobiia bacterium]